MGRMEIFKFVLDTLAVVGTWGAVVVALKLSRASAKKAAEDAEARAGLVAARNLGRLRSIYFGAKQISTVMEHGRGSFARANQFEIPLPVSWRNDLRGIDVDVLAQLLPLPNYCASRLGRAVGELVNIVGDMEATGAVWHTSNQDLRDAWLKTWGHRASETIVILRIAIDECEKAARVHAPNFTAEELGLG
ncbi:MULTISPECIES: hypothetical protein [unclassified Variovorax]|uniref:hypothetical protein n=1 Tax=unclassified Variovorax TaxID=663243 RepID=UPI0032E5F710